jgi:predicted nucleotidyltransferase
MRLQDPLDDILATRSHVRVLRSLMELPEGLPASTREIARRSGVSHPRASAVLNSLTEQGVVGRALRARLSLVEINRAHILAGPLAEIFARERALFDELLMLLREGLQPQSHGIVAAALFGSAVEGEMEPASDIDLAVVVRRRMERTVLRTLEELGELVRTKFGNRLTPLVASVPSGGEWPKQPAIWKRIARQGVPVVGSLPGQS